MKVITYTITHTANFAGGRSRLDLLLPSFLPSREEKKIQDQKNRPLGSRGVSNTPHTNRVRTETKKQDRIFCPLRGYSVGRMQYAPTTCRQETLFPINSREERIGTKIQEQKNRPLGSRGVLHTPPKHLGRDEQKRQDRIFCPLRGHSVGRMLLRPTTCRQESMFQIILLAGKDEQKIHDQKNRPLGCRAQKHTPPIHLGRDEQKTQDRIFCPLRGHSVGRMRYAPTTCRQETLFPINSREERTETKKQDRIFFPLRGHSVGRMRYAPTAYRQETLFPINSREERIETKIQEQKNHPLGSRGVLHTPHMDRVRTETKMQERRKQSIDSGAEWHNPHTDRVRTETKKQDRIFCPLRGYSVGRMQYAPTTCRQETLFPINSRKERIETKIQDQKNRPLGCRGVLHTPHTDRVRTETKMQERRKQSIDSGAEWHTPFMRHGERDAVWRDTFLEQRARVAIWRDRRLEEKSSHARLQMRISRENSNPYKSYLVALSEQLRDIFAA